MSKRAIPLPPTGENQKILGAIRENLQIITGQRGAPIAKLDTTATLADVIAKVNEIIDRLQ